MSQTTTYVEFLEELQSQFLGSVKQAQAFNLKTLATFTEFASSATARLSAELPTPTAIVEQAFGLTTQILEAQRECATKLADLATETQKQFTEATKRTTETAAQTAAQTAGETPQQPIASTKATIVATKSDVAKTVAVENSKN